MDTVGLKVKALELLDNQLEAIEMEAVAAQYAYELVRSLPQITPEAAQNTEHHKRNLQSTRWKRDQTREIIPRMAGLHSLDEVAAVRIPLTAAYHAYLNVKQEYEAKMVWRDLLQGAEGTEDAEGLAAIEQDIGLLEQRLPLLEKKLKELANRISIGDEEGRIVLR